MRQWEKLVTSKIRTKGGQLVEVRNEKQLFSAFAGEHYLSMVSTDVKLGTVNTLKVPTSERRFLWVWAHDRRMSAFTIFFKNEALAEFYDFSPVSVACVFEVVGQLAGRVNDEANV